MSNFQIWITIENDEPTLDDFHLARQKLDYLGINEQSHQIGILLNMTQWRNFLVILSKFEHRHVDDVPPMQRRIMGFPVRLIKDL